MWPAGGGPLDGRVRHHGALHHCFVVLECFAPVKNLNSLPQAAGIEGVGLHEFEHRLFGVGFNNPQTASRCVVWLLTQGASDKNHVFVLVNPSNVCGELLGSELPVTWLVVEDDGEQHGNGFRQEALGLVWLEAFSCGLDRVALRGAGSPKLALVFV